MESLFEYFDGSLIILAIVLFFVTLAVIFLLLNRDINQRRVAFIDRRRNQEKLIFPFYDSDNILVSEDRRTIQDRRKDRVIRVTDATV